MAAACPICCRATRLYASFGKYAMRACGKCHAAICDPLPTPDELTAYYDDEYFDSERYRPGERTRVDAASQPLWNRRLDTLERHLGEHVEPVRCLDIGAGTGVFLQCATARGWSCRAVEFSAEGREEITRNVELAAPVENEFHAETYQDGSLDVITMWAVLEHMPYDATLLESLRRKLAPGGLLALSTPNLDSLNRYLFGKRWRYFLPPEHVILYSYRGLVDLVERSGFQLLEGRSLYSRRALWQGLGGESSRLPWRALARLLGRFSEALRLGDTSEVYFGRRSTPSHRFVPSSGRHTRSSPSRK